MSALNQKVKVGIIGLGHWGPNLVRNFHTLNQSQVIVCADNSKTRLKIIKTKYQDIKLLKSGEDLIKNPGIDAVIIATPTQTHYKLTKLAIEQGKHVFVEKPLATKLTECDRLVNLAAKKKRILFVGHIFIYNNTIKFVKEFIDKGETGRLYYIQINRTNLGPIRNDVSVLWDLAPHDISILKYWTGKIPFQVNAIGGKYLSKQREDVVFANYTYKNGLIANVHVSWLNPKKVREIVVVGSKKMLIWDDMDLNYPIKIYNKTVQFKKEKKGFADTFHSFRSTILDGDTILPRVKTNEPLLSECQVFLDSLRNPKASLSDGKDGRDVVRAILATERSLNNNGRKVVI